MNKILIITNSKDAHVDYCSKKMKKRAIQYARFNTNLFPRKTSAIWRFEQSKDGLKVFKSGGKKLFSFDEIESVWFRKILLDEFGYLSNRVREFAARETEAFFNNMYACLGTARWVNSPFANRFADNKILQLRLAAKLGFEIPDTLITNSIKAAQGFFKKHQRRGVIFKTLKMPFVRETTESYISVYTSLVTLSPQVEKSISVVPCLFQEYIDKAYELRINVVGDQVFAARIFSQEQADTRIDWRRNQHKTNLRYEIERLDQTIKQSCILLIQKLNLLFGAIDMIVTPDGRYIFLEINPNGQWLWIEKQLGLPIADSIIDLLSAS